MEEAEEEEREQEHQHDVFLSCMCPPKARFDHTPPFGTHPLTDNPTERGRALVLLLLQHKCHRALEGKFRGPRNLFWGLEGLLQGFFLQPSITPLWTPLLY